MPHILIVDDDKLYLKMIANSLRNEGYRVTTSQSGSQAIQMVMNQNPDLIILDVLLGNENGLNIVKQIRTFSNLPIILASGYQTSEEHLVKGLDQGADDYLFKPYSLKELLARLRAILRRTHRDEHEPANNNVLTNGPLKINFATAEVWKHNKVIPLSSTEYRLLLTLAQNIGRVMSANSLLSMVWGKEYEEEKEVLWVTIARLRQKIEKDTRNPRIILTKTGLGYIMPNLE